MERISVKVNRGYDVVLGTDILKYSGALIKEIKKPCKALVVTDDLVDLAVGDTVIKSLNANGYNTEKFVIKNGELSKCFNSLIDICEKLAESGFTRSDLIVAQGGGVVGDLAGFAASVYMRGIDFVQIPTTLLAQIDSSVGGKTAIDLNKGKNLVGSFWQPILVIADVKTLETLPNDVFKDGYGEMLKYGILDKEMFSYLSACSKPSIAKLIKKAIEIKRDVVEQDEKDLSVRATLNLGHTPAHGIELLSSYTITHGKAVAMGLYLIVKGSYKSGFIDKETYEEIILMLESNDVYLDLPYSTNDIAEAAVHDKKMIDGKINVITVHGIGKVEETAMTLAEFKEFIK